METSSLPTFEDAATSFAKLLAGAASVVLILSALAYVIGWRQASAYYSTLGIPSVTSMLSPMQLLQLSAWVAIGIGSVALLTLQVFFVFPSSGRIHL